MNTKKEEQTITPIFARDQLDSILAKEITFLLNVDSDTAMMSFNLASISCITIILEREREIKRSLNSLPRFTRETFIDELVDIGLENDSVLQKTIDMLIGKGYISVNSDQELIAELPAFTMAGFLDSMFPGMPGISMIGFILQMLEEVNSGRKSFELAKESFSSILKTRGVSVTKDKADKKASEMIHGTAPVSEKTKNGARKLKKTNLNRLSSLVKHRRKSFGDSSTQLKIKDVFDKGPSKEEIEAQKAEIKKTEQAAKKFAELARELTEKEEKIKEAEEIAKQAAEQLKAIEEKEQQLLTMQKEADAAKEKAAQIQARESEIAQKEAQLKALEEKLKNQENENLRKKEEEKASLVDDDIESQIAAFENELAMPCPLCKKGEVISKMTEKKKEYFSCSMQDCR